MKHPFRLIVASVLLSSFFDASYAKPLENPAPPILDPPAEVSIVRSADLICGSSCPEWISIQGRLTAETEGAFSKVLDTIGHRRLPVIIHSGGGLITVGFAIGRMIRARRLDVAVGKTEIKPCEPKVLECATEASTGILRGDVHSSGARCASACTFILAGGFNRYAAPWSGIGVHQVTDIEKQVKRTFLVRTIKLRTAHHSVVTQKAIIGERDEIRTFTIDPPGARTLGLIRAYFAEMEISGVLQKLMGETDPKSIHWLTHPETETTSLVTDYSGAESLLAKTASDAPGPKLPVVSLSWGVVSMPGFGAQRAKLFIEFIHRKNAPVVEVNAVIDNQSAFSAISQFGLILQFGLQKNAPELVATSLQPPGPLTTTIAVPPFCEALNTGPTWTVKLQDRSINMSETPFPQEPPAYIAAAQLYFMADLMLDTCGLSKHSDQ